MATAITVEEMATVQNTQSEMFLCISIYSTTLDFGSTGFEKIVELKNGEVTPVQSRTVTSLNLLANALPETPRTWLALLAARALLTNIQLAINQDPQILFHGPDLQPLIPQSVQTSRAVLSRVQNPAPVFVKIHVLGHCSVL
ncbi:hypothetical protein BTVI_49499 [Pitangus sulphuratus]|nr:hypothetical protein BTVI_49499 [Pitangus sulphuratus]